MSESSAIALRISPEHPALPGHFPGHPVVPGVVLLERVAAAVRERFDARIEKLDAKFLRPLLPGAAAKIVLQADGLRIRFEVLHANGTALARGSLTVASRVSATPPQGTAAAVAAGAPRQGAGR